MLESLEERRLLTVFTWDGGGDGSSFSDADNWAVDGSLNPATAPSATDDVVIDLDGGGTQYRIQVDQDQQVASVQINAADAQLRLNSGTFTVDTIDIDAGTLVSLGGSVVADSITNDDRIAVGRTQTFDVDEIDNNGSFVIQTSATSRLTVDGTIRNSGNFSMNPSGDRDGTLTVNNGLVVNEESGVITIGAAGSRTQTVLASIENAGELNFAGPRITYSGADATITNDGDLNFLDAVDFNTFDNRAVINQRAGSLVADGDVFLTNGQFNVSGGTVSIPDEIRIDNNGSIIISGGSVDVDGRLLLNQRGEFTYSGGQIKGDRPVEVFGFSDLNVLHDGSFNVVTQNETTVTGALASGQNLAVQAQNSDLIFAPGFVNNGTITFDNPGGSAQQLRTVDGSAFENAADGLLRFTRETPSTVISTFIAAPINNAGAIEVDSVVSDSKLNTLENTGQFTVTADGRYTRSTSGSGATQPFLQAAGTLTNNGTFDGGGLQLEVLGGQALGTFAPRDVVLADSAAGTGTFQPSVSLLGNIQSGQTVIVSRNVEFSGDVSNRGTIRLVDSTASSQTTLDLTNSTLTNETSGLIELTAVPGESAFIDGAVINDGTISVLQGLSIIDGILNRGDVIISAEGQIAQRLNSTFNQAGGRLENIGPFSTRGIFQYSGGQINDTVTLLDTGSLDVVDGAPEADFRLVGGGDFLSDIPAGIDVTLSNDESGAMRVPGPDGMRIDGRLFIGDSATSGSEIKLDVDNGLTVGPTGVVTSSTQSAIDAAIDNQGRIQLRSTATLGRPGETPSNSGLIHLFDSDLTIVGLGLSNEISGEIAGTGTLDFTRGDFTSQPTTLNNSGTINPGQSPGQLSFEVSQTQLTQSSVIKSEIGGSQPGAEFDVLNFLGSLELGGLLGVDLIDDFTPQAGTVFDLINASEISGNFSLIETNPQEGAEAVWTFDTQNDIVQARLAASAIDMSVSNIQAPSSVTPGDAATITWAVTNNGNVPTPSNFVDLIFISTSPEFDVRTSQLVGTRTATTSIAPGQTQQASQTVSTPPFVGRYFYHIVADAQQSFADLDRGNNVGCSDSATIFAAPTMDGFDSPITISAVPGDASVVEIDQSTLSGPASVVVTPTSTASDVTLRYFFTPPSVDSEPNATEFCRPDFGGDCEFRVPDDAPNVIYASVSFSGQPGTPAFTVELTQATPEVTEVSPSVLPNAGTATLTFSGQALPLGGTFQLVGDDGTIIEAENIASRSSSEARATFNFAGRPAQFYSFFHVEDGNQQSLCDQCVGVEQSVRTANVFDASIPQFQFRLSTPSNVAALRESQVEVAMTNTFGVDLSGRLVQLETDNGFFAETGTPQMLVFLGGSGGNVIAPGETARTTVSYVPTVGGGVNISAGLSTGDDEFEVELGETRGISRVLDRCVTKGSGDARVGFQGVALLGPPAFEIQFELLDPDGPDGEPASVFGGTAEIRSDTVGSVLLPESVINLLGSGSYHLKFRFDGLDVLFENVVQLKDGPLAPKIISRNDIFSAIPNGLFTQDERNFVADSAFTSIGGPIYNLQSTWGLYNAEQVSAGFAPATTTASFVSGFANGIVDVQFSQNKVLDITEGDIVVDEILNRCITLDDLRNNPGFKIIVKGSGLAGIDNARIDNTDEVSGDNGSFLPVNVLDDNTVEITFFPETIERLIRNQDGSSGPSIALGRFELTLGDGNNSSGGGGFAKTIKDAIIIVESKPADSQEPDNLRIAAPASFGLGNLDTTHFGRTQISPTISNYVLAGKDHMVIDFDGRLVSANPDIYSVRTANGQVTFTTTTIDDVTLDTTVWRESGSLDNITNRTTGGVIRPTTNSAGKVTSLVNGDNEIIESYTRNDRQQVTQITNSDGTTNLSYDGQLLQAIASAGIDVAFEYGATPNSSLLRVEAIVVNGTRFTLQYSDSGAIDTLTDTTTGEVFEFQKKASNLLAEILGSSGQLFEPNADLGAAGKFLKGFAAPQGVRALIDSQQILRNFGRNVAPLTSSSVVDTKTSNVPGGGQQVAPETHNAVVRGTVAGNRSQRSSEATSQVAIDAVGNATNAVVQFVKKTASTITNFAVQTVTSLQSVFSNVLFSKDPNDILGPEGFGPLRHTTVDEAYDYTIRFENDRDATAPAQEVFITQTLDKDFDINTFEFKSFGWSGVEFDLPAGAKEFSRTIDLQPDRNLVVRATGSVNPTTREVTWALQSLDPLTGSLPVDALNGFLPPNNDSGVGEGFVSYGIDVPQTLTTGTRLDAEASIVFDLNEAIITPPIFNTIDAGAPTAIVDQLAPVTSSSTLSVSWTGADDVGGSGIATFDVFVATDNGPFEPFLLGTSQTTANFVGEDGKSYAFRAVATDNVGFVEADPGIAESTTTIRLNSAPVVSNPIADLTVDEDSTVQSIDLTSVFADTEGDVLTFAATSTDPTLVASTIDGTNLLLSFAANASGVASIAVTANDGELTASDTFKVVVNTVNDAPTVVNPIADVTVNEDAADQTIDLSGVFADIDSSDLTLTAVSGDGSLVNASVVGDQLILNFAQDQNGAAVVTVTADDGELTASDTFNVTVNAVNDAPVVVNPIADVTVDEDAADQTIDLSGVFADVDSSDLTLTAVSGDGSLVNASIVGDQLILNLAEDQNGAATVTVTASDGELTASDTFNVTVNAVNDAPTVVKPVADVTADEDAADQTIDLGGVFADIDSSDLTLTAVSSDGSLVSSSIVGDQLTLSFAADQNGAATVTVTADDGELTASYTFNVTVNAVNDAPVVVNPIPDVTVNEDAADQTIDLGGVFADIDSANLTLAAVSSDGSLVSTSLSGSLLTLSLVAGQTGEAEVTVTASDGMLSASDTFGVTVRAATSDQPVQLDDGILTITGDLGEHSKDRVFLERQGSEIRVAIRQGNGDSQEFEFPRRDVNRIDVNLGDGNDVLLVSSNFRTPINVTGGQGNDWIETGWGSDTIVDLEGDNFVSSGPGRDEITTGDGRDRIYAGAGRDLVKAGGGNDVVYAGDGADIVVGGAGHDWISGGSGRELLIGGPGCDILFGGDGQDLMIGGSTVHDDNDEALQAIASEWNSGRSLARRKANITDGSGSNNRRNGQYFLGSGDLIDDDASDLLFGGIGDDWKL
ncbi:MAG: hypothetical protein Aurels2KO_49200 [Aureliella sp.]